MTRILPVIILAIVCSACSTTEPQEPLKINYSVFGQCVRVIDGDTFEILIDSVMDSKENIKEVKPYSRRVRLWAVDAPELKQPYGKEAKAALNFIMSKTVDSILIEVKAIDQKGQIIGDVWPSVKLKEEWPLPELWHLNEHVVEQGNAWYSINHEQKDKDIAAAQEKAMRQKRGLWSSTQKPVPPWKWQSNK